MEQDIAFGYLYRGWGITRMNSAEKQTVLHCLKSMIDEAVCEECPLYGMTGTDHCEKDCVRLAINALEQEPCTNAKEEIWKDIPEFEGIYEVSNMGRIRSLSRIVRSGRGNRINPTVILKPAIGQWGYEQVCLRKDGKKYTKRVNRLVAQAFIPNPNNLPQVNHIDGDKTNNCVDNLEWCDASHNMKHCFDNRMSNWTTKIRIIETGEVFNSKAECARKIGGHISLIDMCLKGKRKTHKGYHFEIIGERASDKYNRKNVINKKDNYDSGFKKEEK